MQKVYIHVGSVPTCSDEGSDEGSVGGNSTPFVCVRWVEWEQ